MQLGWSSDGHDSDVLLVTGAGLADLLEPGVPVTAAELADRIAVVPASALGTASAVVPMAGRWSVDGEALHFVPRYPFQVGTSYALVRRDDAAGAGAASWVEVAQLRRPTVVVRPTASVVSIHPSALDVPENLLRLSVTFSAPMAEGSAAGNVQLEDAGGHAVPHALLAMPPELWDRPRRRLTLLLEPGRIKRGLVPNTELGSPLAHTSEVTLVVDAEMRDSTGASLVAGARRSYRVGPAVRTRVDPQQWEVTWPTAGSQEPLVVEFDRPLDHALALRCLRVAAADGATVPGRAVLGPGELRWCFTPAVPWPEGAHELHVDTALEDLAGNSVRRVFDRDLRLTEDDPLAIDEVVLSSGDPAGQ